MSLTGFQRRRRELARKAAQGQAVPAKTKTADVPDNAKLVKPKRKGGDKDAGD